MSFMTEEVLKRHHRNHKRKVVKKKRLKGKSKKHRKGETDSKNSSQDGKETVIASDVHDGADAYAKGLADNALTALASYNESDHEDIPKNTTENPQVLNDSLWSKHVQQLQEYS